MAKNNFTYVPAFMITLQAYKELITFVFPSFRFLLTTYHLLLTKDNETAPAYQQFYNLATMLLQHQRG